MSIDVTNAKAGEPVLLDETQDFLIGRCRRLGQVLQCLQYDFALPQIAKRQFSNDERVCQDPSCVENGAQRSDAESQMVDPHRCVDEDHAG